MTDTLFILTKVVFQILILFTTAWDFGGSFTTAGQIVFERCSNISLDLVNESFVPFSKRIMNHKVKENKLLHQIKSCSLN